MFMTVLKEAPLLHKSYIRAAATMGPMLSSKVLDALDAHAATSAQAHIRHSSSFAVPLERSKTSPAINYPIRSNVQTKGCTIPPTRIAKVASESALGTRGGDATKTVMKEGETLAPAIDWYSYKEYGIKRPVYTKHEEEANDLIQMLQPGPVGFDMEWRVEFRRGSSPHEYKTAVIQVCDEHLILVIQISAMKNKFPAELKALIEDKTRIKLGVNILNDGRKLFRDYGIFAANMVELGMVARLADIDNPFNRPMVSLAKITEHYCKKPLAKGRERTSNWELHLTKNMLDYAANDAHCALMVYKNLLKIASDAKVILNLAACAGHIARPPPTVPSIPSVAGTTPAIPAAGNQEPENDIDMEAIIATSVPTSVIREAQTSAPAPAPPKKKVWVRPQHLRAYRYWRTNMSLEDMCKKVSLAGESAPIKPATVIGYIISALQTDTELEFDLDELVTLVQQDSTEWSWKAHRDWIATARMSGRGVK